MYTHLYVIYIERERDYPHDRQVQQGGAARRAARRRRAREPLGTAGQPRARGGWPAAPDNANNHTRKSHTVSNDSSTDSGSNSNSGSNSDSNSNCNCNSDSNSNSST